MDNEEKIAMLNFSIQLLKEANVEKIETIELSHSNYDEFKDFSINLTYSPEQKETITYYVDNEEIENIVSNRESH